MRNAPQLATNHLRALRRFQREPLALLEEAGRLGPIVRLNIGPKRVFIVSGSNEVEHVFVTNAKNYGKHTRGFGMLKLALGEGLLTADGARWIRHRRIEQPAFHRQRIAGFASLMVDATTRRLAHWVDRTSRGESIDVHRECMELALAIFAKSLLSIDTSNSAALIGSSLDIALHYLQQRVDTPWMLPHWIPLPAAIRFRRAMKAVDDLVENIILDRRQDSTPRGDLLELLMNAEDEDTGERLSNQQLRDEIVTFTVAGHETTANALAWTLYLLARHPNECTALVEELSSELNGRVPQMEELARLSRLDRVVKESLRLYPPAWVISRAPHADDVVGGVAVRRNDLLIMTPWVSHRRPEYWDAPNEFRPTRFTAENEKARPKYAYYPFGAGNRKCIGEGFANLELRLALAVILQSLRPVDVEGGTVAPEPLITLRPLGGMRLRFEAVATATRAAAYGRAT